MPNPAYKPTHFHALRSAWAEHCLETTIALTHCDRGEDAVCDSIVNFGHYCDIHGLDFPKLVRRAISHWLTEQIDPESIEAPDVTISVDGVSLTP